MKNILTFIIPVRHQNNAENWRALKSKLTDTIRSIANQDAPGWKAVIVANHGADLPEIPEGFAINWVDFPPNPLYRQGGADPEKFREAFRLDKGRRVLSGMLYAKEMGHVMIVDDDDFVSRRLTSFVSKHPLANGWYVQNGYVWSDGGSWLYLYDSNFSRICGTSHIVRSDLYNIPASLESADDAYLGKMLGSHIFIQEHLQATHKPLAPLPFIGAVYRTGHPESHSRANGIFRQYFLHKWLLKHPITLFKRLSRLRIKGKVLNKEFFGR